MADLRLVQVGRLGHGRQPVGLVPATAQPGRSLHPQQRDPRPAQRPEPLQRPLKHHRLVASVQADAQQLTVRTAELEAADEGRRLLDRLEPAARLRLQRQGHAAAGACSQLLQAVQHLEQVVDHGGPVAGAQIVPPPQRYGGHAAVATFGQPPGQALGQAQGVGDSLGRTPVGPVDPLLDASAVEATEGEAVERRHPAVALATPGHEGLVAFGVDLCQHALGQPQPQRRRLGRVCAPQRRAHNGQRCPQLALQLAPGLGRVHVAAVGEQGGPSV